MRKRDSVLLALVPLLLIPLLINIFTSDLPDGLTPFAAGAGALALLLSVLVAVDQATSRRTAAESATPGAIADRLASAIEDQWRAGARAKKLDRPFALKIERAPVGGELADSEARIRGIAATWGGLQRRTASFEPSATSLAHQLIEGVPTHRLIVLGQAGSGKTVELIHLTLDLLRSRQPGAPVPFLVPIASWNPGQQGFRRWLVDRLIVQNPGLAARTMPDGRNQTDAETLLGAGLILPLVDGLDEMPVSSIKKALAGINDGLGEGDGIVVSCRSAEYTEALGQQATRIRIRGAAGVELKPLAAAQVEAYFEESASGEGERWREVFDALHRDTPLARALQTPLMVALMHTVYASTDTEASPDPGELADECRFPTESAVRRHLLDNFIQAAYRSHPDSAGPICSPEKAERWLIFLAEHLRAHLDGRPDIAWWQLSLSPPRGWTGGVVGVVGGLLSGVAAAINPESGVGLGSGLAVGLTAGYLLRRQVEPRLPLPKGVGGRSSTALGAGLVGGLLGGLIAGSVHPAGITVGVSGGLGVGFPLGAIFGAFSGFVAALLGAAAGEVFAGRGSGLAAGIINGLTTAVALGLVAGFSGRSTPARGPRATGRGLYLGLLMGMVVAIGIGARAAHGYGSALGVVAGAIALIVIGLIAILTGTPADLKTVGPRSLLISDRRTFWLFVGCGAFAGALSVFAGVRVFSGIAAAFAGGLGLAFFQATWGRYRLAHLYLALRRKLPWRLMRFLQDAHEVRGVLRQVGPSYQFRHADLQAHLVSGSRPS